MTISRYSFWNFWLSRCGVSFYTSICLWVCKYYRYIETFLETFKSLVQMFLPLPSGKKLLLVIHAYLLGLQRIFLRAWCQKEITTLKQRLGLQMFLILNFSLTTTTLNFFQETWMSTQDLLCQSNSLVDIFSFCCWQCH